MQKVFDYIEKYHMIEANDKVVVGVSGGADSLCLLFVLLDYSRQVPFTIEAVHVEHGIRGEDSLADARYVEQLCSSMQVAYRCIFCSVPDVADQKKMSLEEAAREMRYEVFEQVRREIGANKIAVAHNREDQAETILFQMARGSGLDGACGIRPVRGYVIRPLLACGRAQIEEYLTAHKIKWRFDATNEKTDYTRNRLRHHVLPLLRDEVNCSADVHLAALGEELQNVRDYMMRLVEHHLDTMAVFGMDRVEMDIALLMQIDETLQQYLVRECLKRAGCGLKNISRQHIEDILALCNRQSGRCITLPGNWKITREFDKLILSQSGKEKKSVGFFRKVLIPGECKIGDKVFEFHIFPNENKNIFQKTYTKWLDYDKINNDLSIRTRRAGDYIIIDRKGSKKKLKVYLIEEKVPAHKRDDLLLLASGSEILWVVGHRISEAYKILPETKNILEIQMIGEDNYVGEDISTNS